MEKEKKKGLFETFEQKAHRKIFKTLKESEKGVYSSDILPEFDLVRKGVLNLYKELIRDMYNELRNHVPLPKFDYEQLHEKDNLFWLACWPSVVLKIDEGNLLRKKKLRQIVSRNNEQILKEMEEHSKILQNNKPQRPVEEEEKQVFKGQQSQPMAIDPQQDEITKGFEPQQTLVESEDPVYERTSRPPPKKQKQVAQFDPQNKPGIKEKLQKDKSTLVEAFRAANINFYGERNTGDAIRALIKPRTVGVKELQKFQIKEYCHMNCNEDTDICLQTTKRVKLGCGCMSRHIQCMITTAIYNNVDYPITCGNFKNCARYQHEPGRAGLGQKFQSYVLSREDHEKILEAAVNEGYLNFLWARN